MFGNSLQMTYSANCIADVKVDRYSSLLWFIFLHLCKIRMFTLIGIKSHAWT